MFPPLCFVDDTKGEMEEEYMNVLKDERLLMKWT